MEFGQVYKQIRNSGFIKKTDLQYNLRLSKLYGANIYLKREDQQTTRSFKIRGAYNKIISNPDVKHVVTCSAGNHAQGVAYTCRELNIKCTIFIPICTPMQKQERIIEFGKEYLDLQVIGSNFDESLACALKFSEENNCMFVHPFNDKDVIMGQATISHEILEEIEIDYLICPVGGGGLISGQIIYSDHIYSTYNIIGVEPENADSMKISINNDMLTKIKDLDTFVDGAAVKIPGDITFNICNDYDTDIYVVSNGELCDNIVNLYNYDGIIAEPAGALSVTALRQLADKNDIIGKTIVCIISGGNNDFSRGSEFIEKSLIYHGLIHYYILRFRQGPGALEEFIQNVMSGTGIDIKLFGYSKKTDKNFGSVLLGIKLKNKDDKTIFEDRLGENKIKYQYVDPNNPLFDFIV